MPIDLQSIPLWLPLGLILLLLQITLIPFFAILYLYRAKRSPMFAHMAKQIMHLEAWLCLILFMGAGGVWFLFPSIQNHIQPLFRFETLFFVGALFCSLIISALLTRQWHALRGKNMVRGAIIAVVFITTTLTWVIATQYVMQTVLVNGGLAPFLQQKFMVPSLLLPNSGALLLQMLLLLCAPSVATATIAIWLLLRRQYDDFGRDYYTVMLRMCAKETFLYTILALLTVLGLLFLLVPIFMALPNVVFSETLTTAGITLVNLLPQTIQEWGQRLPILLPGLVPLMLLSVFLPFVSACLWLHVIYSAVPMRTKPTIVLAWLCLLAIPFLLSMILMIAHQGTV